jgi:hypothetical protein
VIAFIYCLYIVIEELMLIVDAIPSLFFCYFLQR